MKVALLNASGSMQQSVADMASQCAYVLLSISPPDHLSRAVRTYQQEFNERYGVDRVVPLADLMEESGGLGLPSERVSADTWSPQYVRVLANLWSRGVHSGNEVEISEAEIAELAGAHAYDRDWPSTVDINITKETIKAAGTSPGEFRLHVAAYPGCIGAGRYMARFAPWLGQDALRLFAQIGQIESRNAGGDIVELRYLPTKKRLANLIGEAMTPKRVLSDHPLDGDLCVRDIGVVFSQNKLRIVALPSGEEIRVVARHMVNQKFAPRMYRLLIEITNGYTRRLEPFNWGPLKHAAKLPRVVYKHMVLSPARWAIDPSSIMSPNDLEILKLTLGIPDLVTIGSGDSRLLFDLRREPHLNEAYRQIARRKELTWIEAAVDPEACTIVRSKYGEHNGEIVVSLHLKDFEDGVKRSSRYTDSPAARFAPGSEWLYLKLRVTATAEETFLTEGLSEILQTCGAISSPWHFIRYSYPFRHLRLRIKSDRPNDSSFVTAVLSKVEALISAGLVIDVEVSTYWPEVDRFGGKSHLESIMNFFLADSQAAVEALGLTEKGSHQRISIGVALGRTLLSFANWADEDQIKFLRDSGGKYTDVGSRTFRDHRQSFRQMLEGDADDSECAGVAKRFEQKCSLIFRDYKWCEALRDDPSIVGDLLHLQANRLFGIDRQAERLRLEMLYRTIDWIRKYRPL
jgi:thiopeptide-type bacteriocin biosynthesis protein